MKKTLVDIIALGIVFIVLALCPATIILSSEYGFFGPFYLLTILTILAILIIATIIYYYQRWYYAVYFYDLTNDYVQIRKGPITPREITIPYERIQDVYVDQDVFDRIFGLYDVHLSSATASSGMEAHIDGVEKDGADGLRLLLLNKIKEKTSRGKMTFNSETQQNG